MRTRGVAALAGAAALVLGACSSADDDGQLELDDGTAAPAEDQASAEAEPEEPDEPDEDQLYPPLPPLEPDPDSDIPEDEQREALELHAATYAATQTALHSGEVDRDALAQHLAPDLFVSFVESVEGRPEGRVSSSPDTEIVWVRVVDSGSGPIVVQECRIIGPETGVYEAGGERVSPARAAPEARIFQTTYALLEDEDGNFNHKAVEAGSAVDESICDV